MIETPSLDSLKKRINWGNIIVRSNIGHLVSFSIHTETDLYMMTKKKWNFSRFDKTGFCSVKEYVAKT